MGVVVLPKGVEEEEEACEKGEGLPPEKTPGQSVESPSVHHEGEEEKGVQVGVGSLDSQEGQGKEENALGDDVGSCGHHPPVRVVEGQVVEREELPPQEMVQMAPENRQPQMVIGILGQGDGGEEVGKEKVEGSAGP